MKPTVYFTSSEDMAEVEDHTVDCLVGSGVYLGPDAGPSDYERLYHQVYCEEGGRVIKDDGVFICIYSNAYHGGAVLDRGRVIADLLYESGKWTLIDERIWQRRKGGHFQPPFSYVKIYKPRGGTITRTKLNKRGGKPWFQGVWNFTRNSQAPSHLNSYSAPFCDLLVRGGLPSEGGRLVDVFTGAGMLLARAAQAGHEAIGYEIDEDVIPHLKQNGCRVETGL